MSENQPVVMIGAQMLAGLEGRLAEQGYRVARAWEPASVAELGPETRAIMHAGEVKLAPEFLSSLPNLALIANLSVGYDGVDVPWCRAHGIEVTHSRALNADDVADHAMGLLIGAWRGIVEGDRALRDGQWRGSDRLRPRLGLKGRKVGVVGLGAIGEAVALRCAPFGMNVSWWGPREKPGAAWPRAASLLELAMDSDILVIACRADEGNRGMIDKLVIEAVGPAGMIVNVARGQIIDETALIEALRSGALGLAALDVFEQEPTPVERWAGVRGTVLTPHTAGGTSDSIPRMVAMCLENLRCFFAGEPLPTPVAE